MTSLRAAFGMFTVLPVGQAHLDDRVAARAVRWLPLVGAVVGALAMLPALLVWHGDGHGSALVAAAVVVAVQALLTRGLHLDGLADLADGLGSGLPAPGALEVMRRGDVGPFGVVALAFTVLLQVSAIAAVLDSHPAPLGYVLVVVSAAASRLSVVWASGAGTPAARPDGFGALVAGATGRTGQVVLTLAVAGAALLAAFGAGASVSVLGWLLGATAFGVLAAVVVRRHAVRRLGGVTGDVFGALVEVTATLVLLVLAAEAAWR